MKIKLTAILTTIAIFSQSANAANLIEFWNSPQHGGNVFNRMPASSSLYLDLSGYNASWVRIAYDKWESEHRDFLIGDADHFRGIIQKDLVKLKKEINNAGESGLKVVIAPLSLPMYRWAQNNNNRFDGRLFESEGNWKPAITFWRELATELKDNPHVAAYNILNEPAPEKLNGLPEHSDLTTMSNWYKKAWGIPS